MRRSLTTLAVFVIGLALLSGVAAAAGDAGESMTMTSADAVEPVEPVEIDSEYRLSDQNGTLGCDVAGFIAGSTTAGPGTATGSAVETICDVTYQSVSDAPDNTSLYNAALQTDAANNQYFTLLDNYLQDTESRAWMHAEAVAAKEARNGTTESVAINRVNDEIEAYYTFHEYNIFDRWNVLLSGMESYEAESSGLNYDMFSAKTFFESADNTDWSDQNWQLSAVDMGYGSGTATLPNGSSTDVRTLKVDYKITSTENTATWSFTKEYGPDEIGEDTTYTMVYEDSTAGTSDHFMVGTTITFRPITSVDLNSVEDLETRNYLSSERFQTRHDEIETQVESVKSGTETFVKGTYNEVLSGEINATDLLSRLTKMDQYALNGQGDNVSFNDGIVALSSLGLSTPAVNGTSYLNLTFESQSIPGNITREGMLLSSDSPTNGSWSVGETYDSSNFDGGVMVSTLSGSEYQVNGTFTITEAFNDNGDPIGGDKITSPDTEYSVSNTNETQRLLETISERLDRYDDLTTDNSGAGSGTDDDGPDTSGILNNFLSGFLNGLGGVSGGLGQWAAYVAVALIGLIVVLRMLSG